MLCDVTFLRPFQEWELETLHSFFACIYSCKIGGGGIDRIGWLPSKSKIFEVVLLQLSSSRQPMSFTWKSVSRVNIPPKVAFFKWTAAKGRILKWIIFVVENFVQEKCC